GALTLTGTNTYTGTTTISSGTLQIGNGGTAGTINNTSAIVNNGSLVFNNNSNYTIAPTAGSGSLIASATTNGFIRLGGNITQSGSVSISTLTTLASSAGIRQSGNTTITASAISLQGQLGSSAGDSNFALTLDTSAANGPILLDVYNGSSGRTFIGATSITANSGTGTLTVGAQAGRFSESGAWPTATLTGGISITAAFAQGALSTGTGGFTLNATAPSTISSNLTLGGTSTNVWTVNPGVTMAVSGRLAGTGAAITKSGSGTLTLSGSNSYSGATTISSGVISFGNKNAFSATSGISIAGGAGLTYTGTADTLSTGITVTSGTGTVTNSGGQTLTLGGTLSKNGTVLRLTGGAFNVTGLITGTTAGASDLVVDAAAVTLSNTNTYDGPTYVYNSGTLSLGIDNAIPNTSAVYLGNNTTRGTLVLGSYTDSISQLLFSGSGGTVSLSGDKTAAAQLATNGSLALGSNANLVLTSAGTSAGLYRLISFTSSSGSFASITGTSAAYQVITTSSSIDYQQRAVLGAVGVTNPAVSIITGGSAAFTYTVANSALSGGASLGFTSSSLSANLAGTSSGTAAAGGSSGAISGLVFTGTTVGSGQTGTFTVSAPTAYGATTATGTVSVNVLDHALPGFLASGITNAYAQDVLNIDFGSVDESAGQQSFTYSLLNLASQTYGAGLTAGLDFTGVTADGGGFASGLSTFNNLVGGGTSSLFTLTFNPTGQGTFSKTFTLSFHDNRNLSGAASRRDLTISANVIVVPEPGTLALAGLGIGVAAWALRRRK
ncbi:MAG: PEP-CTERM sorting domain-containing protein, partial [Planctomycetia bacterium]|nr:PEP-CTERM sorting domain-containing protein [Planctomycetia bacterium]